MKIALNNQVSIDLDKLVESRLLVQANSGGGKSWAIRRIIEQAFGHVQIIVIDPEGEFGNMRSRFDFVYAGKGGDAPVESRSAALLAHRLLELKASTIVDLYELPPQERKHFVKLFCEAMVNAPKELWHDCLIIIDEAHVFAPEKGESEAMGPVIDLATRGRKRGYCVVLATQRLPKLNKDAAAECNNKLIGRASQDIDRKRAAEELGFTTKEQILSLRDLDPGQFYAFGPAISREVIKLEIGDVAVKPPKRGAAKQGVAAPSKKVKEILGKLADLPKEAAEEARTVADLKIELRNARSEVTRLQKVGQVVHDTDAINASVKKAVQSRDQEWGGVIKVANKEVQRLAGKLNSIAKVIGGDSETVAVFNHPQKMTPMVPIEARKDTYEEVSKPGRTMVETPKIVSNEGISGPEQRILDAIAWLESIGVDEPEQTAVAFLAGYTYGGGGFNNPKGSLRTKGLIEYRGKSLVLTHEGHQVARIPDIPLTQDSLHAKVLAVLPTPEQRLLKPLLEAYPGEMSNEELAEASGYKAGTGGFNNPKGRLRTLGLISYPSSGRVKAREILFI